MSEILLSCNDSMISILYYLATSLYVCIDPRVFLLRAEEVSIWYCVVYRVVSTSFSWYRVMFLLCYSYQYEDSTEDCLG